MRKWYGPQCNGAEEAHRVPPASESATSSAQPTNRSSAVEVLADALSPLCGGDPKANPHHNEQAETYLAPISPATASDD